MTDLADIPLTTITGEDARPADWAGQVLLIVNVASRCGLTPQYAGLQSLYDKYKEEGLAVLGPRTLLLVNDNDFGIEGVRTRFWRVELAEDL